MLVFASSPLVGSGIPGANRYSVAAISPLSGVYGEGEAGGWWSPESRYAYDYFDVLTSDGTLSRLRFDHVSRAWHVDAVYD